MGYEIFGRNPCTNAASTEMLCLLLLLSVAAAAH